MKVLYFPGPFYERNVQFAFFVLVVPFNDMACVKSIACLQAQAYVTDIYYGAVRMFFIQPLVGFFEDNKFNGITIWLPLVLSSLFHVLDTSLGRPILSGARRSLSCLIISLMPDRG